MEYFLVNGPILQAESITFQTFENKGHINRQCGKQTDKSACWVLE